MASETSPPLFEYVSCLGNGSFGVVFKAKDSTTDSHSAVKIIFPGDKPEDLKYLQRECEVMKDRIHPNVVKVLNVFKKEFNDVNELEEMAKLVDAKKQIEFDHYMATIQKRKKIVPAVLIEMELCGSTLREWLNQHVDHDKMDQSLEVTQVTIIQDMISGMEFLHKNKIIHRDFKPENVMFSFPNPNEIDQFPFPLKIGDFGLSRILHSEKSKTSVLTNKIGSLNYMAPEMDGNEYNFQCDIYSLGLVIWEVAQLIPYKDRKDMFNFLLYGKKTELVDSFSPKISSLIISMTKKNLEERTESMLEVDRLFKFEQTLNELGKMGTLVRNNLEEIVKLLVEDKTIHINWKKLARGTELPHSKVKTLTQKYINLSTFTLDEVLEDVLMTWCEKSGPNATITALCAILETQEMRMCDHMIKTKFSAI